MLTATSTANEAVTPFRFMANNPTRKSLSLNCVIFRVSRQSEKFLFGQSRKFLLTAVRLRDGTNRDESGGTRLVGLVEACTGWKDHAEASRRTDGREPAVGPEAAAAHETRRRSGGGAWTAGETLQP